MRDHPMGTAAEFLAMLQLLHRKKENTEHHVYPGRREGRSHCRAHHMQAGQADNIFQDSQQEIYDGR
jgi:hypothetical protein